MDGKIYNSIRPLNISVLCYIKIMSKVLYCKVIIGIFCIQISLKSLGMKLSGKSYIANQYFHRNNISSIDVSILLGCGSTSLADQCQMFRDSTMASCSRVDMSVKSLALFQFRINSKRAILDMFESIPWKGD
jgi:hypothetical protein